MMRRLRLFLLMLLALPWVARAQDVWDGSIAESYAGGSGTMDDPFLIENGAQLAKLAQDVNLGNFENFCNFKLEADIVLNDTQDWESWNESTAGLNPWTPIGDAPEHAFFCELDGAGHTVSGIYISGKAFGYYGLLGCIETGSRIKNLQVAESFITVTATFCRIGGICGFSYGSISNCSNSGNVSGSGDKGGIGGICGFSYGSISNCFNCGKVSGSGYVGGVCGEGDSNFKITLCYWLEGSADQGIGSGSGSDSSESKTAEAFASGEVAYLLSQGDGSGAWGQTLGTDPYPVIGGQTVYRWTDGTYRNDAQTYIEISTADELRAFADRVNNGELDLYGKLIADIKLNDTENWESWDESTTGLNSWTPIGASNKGFSGVLDGDGHTVSGIYIKEGFYAVGLVGVLLDGGEIKNLTVEKSGFFQTKKSQFVGGVCGNNDAGTISNCSFNSGRIVVGGSVGYSCYFGGVCGYNQEGTINGCRNGGTVSVSESGYCGGVCGYNSIGTISDCENAGTVSSNASSAVGGICGVNYSHDIRNCFNSGSVSGYSPVGGVCGSNSSGVLSGCYNNGSVSGGSDTSAQKIGGVCGYNSGVLSNCYNSARIDVSVYEGSSVGGVCGYNSISPTGSGSFTNCYNWGEIVGNEGLNIGAICGYNEYWGFLIDCCYWLAGTADRGIGGMYDFADAESKSAEAFASGEVAYQLSQGNGSGVWGQTIGSDNYPVLTADASKRVYSATVYNGTATPDTRYGNSGSKLSLTGNAIAIVDEDSPFTGDNIIVKDDNDAYTCLQLFLTDGTDFYTPVTFTASKAIYNRTYHHYIEDASKGGNNCSWETLCLPFSGKLMADGQEVGAYASATDSGDKYWLKTLAGVDDDNTLLFGYATAIEAHKPYIITFRDGDPEKGWPGYGYEDKTITVEGTNVVVGGEDQLFPVGSPYVFKGSYRGVTLMGTETYYLLNEAESEQGDRFLTGSTIQPFRCFIQKGSLDIGGLLLAASGLRVEGMVATNPLAEGLPTGAETVADGAWRVYGANGKLVIESAEALPVAVYAISGRLVWSGEVVGKREIPAAAGIYVVNGVKVAL